MKIFKIFFPAIFFVALAASAAAQETPTAKEEFETYERNFSQVKPAKSAAQKNNAAAAQQSKSNSKTTVKPPAKTSSPQVKPPSPVKTSSSQNKSKTQANPPASQGKTETKTATSSVGSPGMKIWLEKQTNCAGAFFPVAPTSVFKTGDCVRARFRLNFEGYLTIVNYGSSGSRDTIFPLNNQSNKISPKTDHIIPDNRGWEFYNEAGDENLFFIVSNSPLGDDVFTEVERHRGLETDRTEDLKVYDRDLRPRTEQNEVFILASETRLDKPLIFRLSLKHR